MYINFSGMTVEQSVQNGLQEQGKARKLIVLFHAFF